MEERENTASLPEDAGHTADQAVGADGEAMPREASELDANAPVAEVLPSEGELQWGFGADSAAPERKNVKTGVFFAVFGGVIGLCLLLLAGVMFLGDNGIDIIKTLYNERVVYVREDDGTSGLLTPQEAADAVRKSTVTVLAGSKSGSGFVYDDAGHICTNYHVIQGEERIQLILPDGQSVDAEVVGFDVPADLAVLKVDAEGLVPATIGSSAELLVGDEVVAVGTPIEPSLAGTATFGRVSSTRRLLPMTDVTGAVTKKLTLIQTDVSVNHGNSGGPLADMYGRVVGVVSMKMESSYYTYEGLGFAIPIDGARVILDAIISDGAFTGDNPIVEGRSQLGLTGHGGVAGKWYLHNEKTGAITESDTEVAGAHYMPADGVYVLSVEGATSEGRIFAGDVILRINGQRVATTYELIGAVNRHYAGEKVTLSVLRGEEEIKVEIRLGEGDIT